MKYNPWFKGAGILVFLAIILVSEAFAVNYDTCVAITDNPNTAIGSPTDGQTFNLSAECSVSVIQFNSGSASSGYTRVMIYDYQTGISQGSSDYLHWDGSSGYHNFTFSTPVVLPASDTYSQYFANLSTANGTAFYTKASSDATYPGGLAYWSLEEHGTYDFPMIIWGEPPAIPDRIDPEIGPCDPENLTQTQEGNITFRINATDNILLNWLNLTVDGYTDYNSSPYNGSFWEVTKDLSAGLYIWGACANDTSGNSACESCELNLTETPITTTTIQETTTTIIPMEETNNSVCIRIYATRPRLMWNQTDFSYIMGDNYENIIFPGASCVLNNLDLPVYSYCAPYVGILQTGGSCCFNVSMAGEYYVRFYPNLNCVDPPNDPSYTRYTLGVYNVTGENLNASYVTAYSNSPDVTDTAGIKDTRIGSMFYEIMNIGMWVLIAGAVIMSAVWSGGNWIVPVIVFIIGLILKAYIGKWGF